MSSAVEGQADSDERGGWYIIDRETRKPVAGPFATEKGAQEHHRTALNGGESLEVVNAPPKLNTG